MTGPINRGQRTTGTSAIGAIDAPPIGCAVGPMEIRPIAIPADTALIHDWVNRDYARYWGMGGMDRTAVTAAYQTLADSPHTDVFVGLHRGRPAFVVETYDPHHHPIANHYTVAPSDLGMHLLVAPAETPIRGFTTAVFFFVMDFLFSDAHIDRVIVEPDVRNDKIRALNRRAGFIERGEIVLEPTSSLPGKIAMFSWCTRSNFLRARARRGDR